MEFITFCGILVYMISLMWTLGLLYEIPSFFIHHSSFATVIDILTKALGYDHYRTEAMIVRFPREIGCSYQHFGPSGTIQISNSKCFIPNQIYTELCHILALIFAFACLNIQLINGLYIAIKLIIFSPFGPSSTKTLKKLSINQIFLLHLLQCNNIPLIPFNNLCKDLKVLSESDNVLQDVVVQKDEKTAKTHQTPKYRYFAQ